MIPVKRLSYGSTKYTTLRLTSSAEAKYRWIISVMLSNMTRFNPRDYLHGIGPRVKEVAPKDISFLDSIFLGHARQEKRVADWYFWTFHPCGTVLYSASCIYLLIIVQSSGYY